MNNNSVYKKAHLYYLGYDGESEMLAFASKMLYLCNAFGKYPNRCGTRVLSIE